MWTQLSRAGYDTYRDHLNTPAFLQMLPEVNGLTGLDIGCGEGSNTRELAARQGLHDRAGYRLHFYQHAYNFPARRLFTTWSQTVSTFRWPRLALISSPVS